MAEIYKCLGEIVPIKRILISLAVGIVTLIIVLVSGLTSDFVREETVASRTFSAFSFMTLLSFILLMSCEEYAIFKTKCELENLIDDAPLEETGEEFDREEYLHEEDEEILPAEMQEPIVEPVPEAEPEPDAPNAFQPMNFNNLSNQH